MNLAVNARDAMPDGGRLAIATRHVHFARPHVESGARIAPGDYVLLSVADTGLGMDDRTREQVFEPFFTTKAVGKGTGLGLATVYGIVKQNGGFIFVDSARGLGTTFKIYLPQVAPPQPRVEEMVHVEDAGAGHETVVVVEDAPEVRGLLTDYLQTRGYTVLSAENGEQALALCRSLPTPPALLITDIVMPGMSGQALAEQLRGRWRQMKVLYVSGYSDDAQLRRGVLPNGTHLLQKPFTLSLLAGKVRDIIDGTAAASR
jgi:CheY-like chemotaxis protein